MFLKNGDSQIVGVLGEEDLTEEQKKAAQALAAAEAQVTAAPAKEPETPKSENN